jgi:hypothetical protein
MKKHLVAFLSMIGLAGSVSPLRAQVLKGAEEKAKTKTENTIKLTNANKEKNATNAQIQDKRKDKWAKANAENKAVKTDLENKAAKGQSKLKLKQETLQKQNTANGQKNALTKAGLTKAALTKAKGNEQK